MKFKEEFAKAVREQDPNTGTLYEAFVSLSFASLPSDADARYQYLRSPQGRFVARDEADVDVYVTRVARKHIEKFRWLYKSLFESRRDVFTKDVDLVVWGCGCGLDLLALYDCALAEKNPQLWMKVRHVTLIDISEAALERAKQVAEILFPFAEKEGVVTIRCNLMNHAEIEREVELRTLNAFLPRLHLISNFLDLLPNTDATAALAEAVKKVAARYIKGVPFYNELFVAFSPEYRGNQVERNMEAFRRGVVTGTRCEDVSPVGNEPLNCKYFSFICLSMGLTGNQPLAAFLKSFKTGRNHVLNRLVSLDPIVDSCGFDFNKFICALRSLRADGEGFFNVYRWVDVNRYKGQIQRVVFVAGLRENRARLAPLVVEVPNPRKPEIDAGKAQKWALDLLEKRRGCGAEAIEGTKEDFVVARWDGSRLDFCGNSNSANWWRCDSDVDYSLYFRIDPGDAELLPNCEREMDDVQREIVYSRAQYRKIRGSAGCGKSTTMMWHALMSVLRTHLPALLVCKTNTLVHRNERRMAATFLNLVAEQGLDCVASDMFKFTTLDNALCEHRMCISGCPYRHCKRCANVEMCGDKPRPENECQKFEERSGALPNFGSVCCDPCRAESCKVFTKNSPAAKKFKPYGAVMIDEVQSATPELVQAVVNLTYGGNPNRECYLFCDERQTLEDRSVEMDEEAAKKLRVRIPDGGRGYGRWVTLKKPHRISNDLSGRLADVAMKLQKMTTAKYGEVEVDRLPQQMSLSASSVFLIQRSMGKLCDEVQGALSQMKAKGSESITILCDRLEDVRQLLSSTIPHDGWISTHLDKADTFAARAKERRLRMSFREQASGVQLTTVRLAQGWDFKNVLYVMSSDLNRRGNVQEEVLTGATRATSSLVILDRSSSGWLYEALKEFND